MVAIASTASLAAPELKTDDRAIRRVGALVLIITFVIFGTWSLVAPLGSAALAPGVVSVESHRKTIQHLEGGIVKTLHVSEGDHVAAGDKLLTLDGTQSNGELEIVKGQEIAATAIESRLRAERDGLAEVVFPEHWQDSTDERIAEGIKGQNQIFQTRKTTREGGKKVLQQRLGQLQAQLDGLVELKKTKESLAVSYAEEIADLRELVAEGFADKRQLREFERSHAAHVGEAADLHAQIAATQIKKGETELEILQLEKEFQEEVASQLGEVQAALFELRERSNVLRDRVRRVDIVAPVGGKVMALNIHTEGGVVTPGNAIMEIVPAKESLIIEAEVSPIDVDRVVVGMTAEVRFSAFRRATTPSLEGKVISLSGDRLVNENTGEPFYLTRVQLTEQSVAKLDGLELVPGMPAEVLIKTADRTLFQYLSQPFTNMFARSFIED